ncbi:MAG: preprotein translocase subunit SecG [Candidatus Moranbacteria bacterium]|jgi:protein translocase SecG subunit|nr:preprotein translocase subunit SecG [Candidatus Moranbacteria bacterium]
MKFTNVLQIIVSVLLIVSILMQNKGSGLSAVFGGDTGGYYAKRGFEKFLLYFSAVLAIIFIALAIVNIFNN